MVAKAASSANLVFGTASLSEVEAVLITAALAGVLAAWGVITTRVIARRQATISYLLQRSTDKDMISARATFNELSNLGGKLSLYTKPSDLTAAETDATRLVLNDWEQCSIAIQHGVYDLRIISQNSKNTVIRDWTRAAPFIYKLRNEIANPFLFHEFEELVRWIQDNKMPKRRTWVKLWF